MKSNFQPLETEGDSVQDFMQKDSSLTFGSSNKRKRTVLVSVLVCVLVASLIVGLVLGLRRSKGRGEGDTDKQTQQTCYGRDDPSPPQCPWTEPPLIVISLDGFRAEYLRRNLTSTLETLRQCGVHPPYMRSTYPTVTYPNHYTIVTGLYPESHGIVNNWFYDQHINETFILGHPNNANPEWWGGEPIWVTAQRQNVTTASYFWVGSEFEIQGTRPDYYYSYNNSHSFEDRVDQALAWLDLADGWRPRFITLYFNEPDHVGHTDGPNSEKLNQQLAVMDGLIKRLMDGLMQRQIGHCVNLVILSDHGMTETSCDREVYLKCFFDVDKTWIAEEAAVVIDPRFHKAGDAVLNTQNPLDPKAIEESLECQTSHYKVFTKDTLPKRFHYTNNDRIGDVLADAQDGWLVYGKSSSFCLAGLHGYDNLDKNMQAFFLGFGPGFQKRLEVEPFENIELYNLFCDLLGIRPAPNNGTEGSLYHLMSNPPALKDTSDPQCVPDSDKISPCNCYTTHHSGGLPLPCTKGHDQTNDRVYESGSHTVVYSPDFHMPVAAVMQLTSGMDTRKTLTPSCSSNGAALSGNSEAGMYLNYSSPSQNIVLASLLPVDDVLDQCNQSLPLVPMYKGFATGIWSYLWKMLSAVVEENSKDVLVTVGPVFDSDRDGLFDPVSAADKFVGDGQTVPIPTHFYASLIKCGGHGNIESCSHNGEILSFIIPHLERVRNCLDYNAYLLDNVVRVKDIELLTGMQLLRWFPLNTRAQAEVRLPTSLWTVNIAPERDGNKTVRNDSTCITDSTYQPVLLISLDGFRHSYLDYNVTPNIARLIEEGVLAERLLSAYPSITFPNHYTIATGLYPESHGIIDNSMFDANLMSAYRIGSPASSDPHWYDGDPIWLTSKRHGKKSACFFWVGSDVAINGEYPDYYVKYDGSVEYGDRVQKVIEWLSMPGGERPELVTLYFEEPDHTGHAVGPDSGPEMLAALIKVDNTIGDLLSGLENRNLYNSVNKIIVSDHGMVSKSCDRVVSLLDKYFTRDEIYQMYIYNGAAARISNKYIYSSRQYQVQTTPLIPTEEIMSRLVGSDEQFAVYEKSQLPKRLHYANNIRIDDIIVKMNDGWIFARFPYSGSSGCSGGTHGYDTQFASMAGLFVAHGPAFKEGVEVPPFENIEIYNLITDLLNITGSPNNGTRGSLHHILKNPPSLQKETRQDLSLQSVSLLPSQIQSHCTCSSPQQRKRAAPVTRQPSKLLQPTSAVDSSLVFLSYDDHVSAYSTQLHMPLWTTFTVLSKDDVLQAGDSCIVPDSNLPATDVSLYTSYTNNNLNVTAASVFTAASADCGSVTYSSATLPMRENLKNDLWEAAWQEIQKAAGGTRLLAVTVGPIFDYDVDGLADSTDNITEYVDAGNAVPLPSHYFIIVSRCPPGLPDLSCDGDIQLLTFILPNDQPMNAQSQNRRLQENVARVRDVELLTGLTFHLSDDPATNARLRTHVPLSLWSAPTPDEDITPTTTAVPTTKRPGSWTEQPCPGAQGGQCPSDYNPVLLISLDGFRADYLIKYNKTPAIDRLSQCGVHAPYMRSVYPTKTFPNHYTIATGLYPESHGIIDNNMYDIDMQRKFALSLDEKNNPAWWEGEPIWLTAQRHGLKSATYFWPGSDVEIQGQYPDYYKTYDGGVPYADRVDTVLQWLSLPADQRPQFLTLYFDEPDHTGHAVGPDSQQIGEKLAEVDSMIDRLMAGLYQRDLQHCVNVIIVADHGMSELSCERQIVLAADISSSDMDSIYVYEGPVARISTRYKYENSASNILLDSPRVDPKTLVDRLKCSTPHMRAFTRETMPLRHHYTNNHRIDEIVLDGDDGWTINRQGDTTGRYCSGGNHGFDNLYASMHALFLAHGPAFKTGVVSEPFENIELYNLFADLLGITPAPNNGTKGSLYHLLVSPPTPQPPAFSVPPACSTSAHADVSSAQQSACQCTTSAAQSNAEWSSPLGEPAADSDGPTVCSVKHADRAVGYDSSMNAPAWVSFTVHNLNISSTVGSDSDCVVKDTWLGSGPILSQAEVAGTNYQAASLFFGSAEACNAVMASEVVSMLSGFKTGVWHKVQQLVADYSTSGELGVTVGPVYDHSHTSKWEGLTNNTKLVSDSFPVPSHIFVIVGRCADQSSSLPCWDSLELLSFIIPHRDAPSNCQTLAEMLIQNVARVRDIEIATGLRFFSDLPVDQAARLRTFLPTELWNSILVTPSPKPGHWMDQGCPQPDHADNQCPSDYRPVLMVSMDGFKPEYLHRGVSPVIDHLVSCGVHAPYMRPVYPSMTFPNHYSIATGLYPESHGIIDNSMYDNNIGERFSIGSPNASDPRWWGGEPIWITAQKANVTAATFFWVGSDFEINGIYPKYYKHYAGAVPFAARVDTVLQWMTQPADQRPDLILLYFDEPDHQAHDSGPFTPEVDEQIRRVDTIIGYLMDGLYQRDLHHCVNLVLVSDHGFSSVSCDQVVELNDYFNETEREDSLYYYMGAFGRIANTYKRNQDNSFTYFGNNPRITDEEIEDRLNCTGHMRVYQKTDVPARHHYSNNDRIDNIILDMDLNWTVTDEVTGDSPWYCTGGSHGWDNLYRAMSALFVGYGPAFQNGHTVEPFENIELYNIISDLLGIQPAPNNGTKGSLDHLLWKSFSRSTQSATNYTTRNARESAVTPCNCPPGSSHPSLENFVQSLATQDTAGISQEVLPFGSPLLMGSNNGATLLFHPSHVTAYSEQLGQPLWVSATVSASMLTNLVEDVACFVSDPRLQLQCHGAGHQNSANQLDVITSLLPSGFDFGETSALVSSAVPMNGNFIRETWAPLQNLITEWAKGCQDLNVISGPAFDMDNNGIADSTDEISRSNSSLPTHLFVIVSRCNDTSVKVSECGKVQTLSFILRQEDHSRPYNCQSVEEYLKDNEARVRDVELITGLQFFPSLPFPRAVAMRTFLPSGLWPASS